MAKSKQAFGPFLWLICAVAGLAMTQASNAQENAAASNPCHELDAILDRLKCYDEQTKLGVENEPQSAAWKFREEIDPLTDAEISMVYLEPEATKGQDAPTYFVIQCNREGSYYVYMETDGFIGTRDRVKVSYRWQDEEVIEERWITATGGKGAFLPEGYKDFLTGLESGGRLVFEWADYRGGRSQAIWTDASLNEDAKYILSGCKNKN